MIPTVLVSCYAANPSVELRKLAHQALLDAGAAYDGPTHDGTGDVYRGISESAAWKALLTLDPAISNSLSVESTSA